MEMLYAVLYFFNSSFLLIQKKTETLSEYVLISIFFTLQNLFLS
jgi:hypothetical protein